MEAIFETAHPIEIGLVLEGEDALEFLEYLRSPKKPSKEQMEMFKEAIQICQSISHLPLMRLIRRTLLCHQWLQNYKSSEQRPEILIRSIGMEPSHFDRRLKLLFLIRLYNLRSKVCTNSH
jgi:hypothetical protein